MQKYLVTGATGFVGRNVIKALIADNNYVVAQSRSGYVDNCQSFHLNIDSETRWDEALKGVNVIIHCAARVHQMNERASQPCRLYNEVNVDGTLNLARQAVKKGVRRFVFISSIKVNGEWSNVNKPFLSSDTPAPQDHYGVSKYEAERQLLELGKESGLEIVIIRPPLVYGPGVKANFLSMIQLMDKGIPLPFGAINSLRSLLYVGNLADFILVASVHPNASGNVFLISDDDDVSVSQLFRSVSKALGKKDRLVPVSQRLLTCLLNCLGKKDVAQRLCKPLQVDITNTKSLLNWSPSYSLKEGLKMTIEHYNKDKTN